MIEVSPMDQGEIEMFKGFLGDQTGTIITFPKSSFLKNEIKKQFYEAKDIKQTNQRLDCIFSKWTGVTFQFHDIDENEKTGVLVGSGIGGLETIANTTEILNTKGARKISPFFIPSALINLISGQISIKYNFKGPNHSVVTACSTGAHAIGDAAKIIESGKANVMVAGGSEAACCRIGMAGFAAAKALSTNFNENPQAASRPWDRDRDGFVMGEGSGIVVLEEKEHAVNRGAKIYSK